MNYFAFHEMTIKYYKNKCERQTKEIELLKTKILGLEEQLEEIDPGLVMGEDL